MLSAAGGGEGEAWGATRRRLVESADGVAGIVKRPLGSKRRDASPSRRVGNDLPAMKRLPAAAENPDRKLAVSQSRREETR